MHDTQERYFRLVCWSDPALLPWPRPVCWHAALQQHKLTERCQLLHAARTGTRHLPFFPSTVPLHLPSHFFCWLFMCEVKYGCMLERVHPCRQLQHVCIITQHCIGFCYALVSNITLYYTSDIIHHYITLHCITQQTGGMQKPLPLNQQQLSRAWDVSQRSTAADWNEWLRRLNVDLLKESPSPALRSCSALAQAYTPLARDLFHAAFVSCWHELSEQYQDSLVRLKFIL